jgi:O-antigen/teichoic acid export membrane protein
LRVNSLLPLKDVFDRKLTTDTLLTMGSLGVVGLMGFMVNVIIGTYYSPESLGTFNQVYAIYILFSQLAVGGVHNSTLKHVAEFEGDRPLESDIVISSLILVILLALPVTFFYFITRHETARLFSSPDLAVGIAWSAVGLFFFALNKNLLAVLNAKRQITEFALLQALRVALMALALMAACALNVQGNRLSLIFSASELTLFAVLLYRLSPFLIPSQWGRVFSLFTIHLRFGSRSLIGGLVSELNTRVDILVLSYFSTTRVVGLYSMAAIAVEFIQQAAIALRTNVNPILVKLYVESNRRTMEAFIRKVVRVTYLGILAFCIAGLVLFYVTVNYVTVFSEYQTSFAYFFVLVLGLIAGGGYIPVNQMMMQSGHPGWQTILFSAVLIFNVLANIGLAASFQALGAASATAASIVFSALAVKFFSWNSLGLKI